MNDYGAVLSPTEVRFERLLPGPIETVSAYITDSKKRGWRATDGAYDKRVAR